MKFIKQAIFYKDMYKFIILRAKNNFKKIISTILLCSPVIAEANVYIGIGATGSLVRQKSGKNDYNKIFNDETNEWKKQGFDNLNKFGAGVDFRFGYKFNNPIRIELMFNAVPDLKGNDRILKNKNKKTSLSFENSSNTLMANIYYDFHNESDFTPWAFVGLGLSNNRLLIRERSIYYKDDEEILARSINKNSKNDFAYSFGLGSSYQLTKNAFVDAGIRYVNRGSASINIIEKNNYDVNHKIKLHSIDTTIGIRISF